MLTMTKLMFTSSLLYGSWQRKTVLLPLSFIEYYLKEYPGYSGSIVEVQTLLQCRQSNLDT